MSAAELQSEALGFLGDQWSHGDGYLEWGMGKSTLLSLESRASVVVSIESDANWFDMVATRSTASVDVSRHFLLKADVGATGPWGYPLGQVTETLAEKYILDPLLEVESQALASIRTVLVDGRFRVACAATSILLLPQIEHILVDDYNLDRRSHYQVVESFAGSPVMLGRCALFRIRASTSKALALRALRKAITDPR